jgi:hypothetical protein
MENSLFVTDKEIIDLANEHLSTVYNACVEAYGDNVFADEFLISGMSPAAGSQGTPATTWPVTLNFNGGGREAIASKFTLPANFSRLLRCEFVAGTVTSHTTMTGHYFTLDNGAPNITWTPMRPIDLAGAVIDSTPQEWKDRYVSYWLSSHPSTASGETENSGFTFCISFLPIPSTIVSIHILYVPSAPQWNADDSGLIKVPDIAWRYVRESTVADVLEKQRSDSRAFRGNAAQAMMEIKTSKIEPDFANPQETTDVGGFGVGSTGHQDNRWH